MPWKLRTDEDNIPRGRMPDYGPNPSHFTIIMHHHGIFKRVENTIQYLDGKVDYFDWCCADEINMLEIIDMGSKIGFESEGCCEYYPSLTGVEVCTMLDYLQTDKDALGLEKLVNEDRVVVVYVHSGPVLEENENENEELGWIEKQPGGHEEQTLMSDEQEGDKENGFANIGNEEGPPQFDEFIIETLDLEDAEDDAYSVGTDTDISDRPPNSDNDFTDDEAFYEGTGETQAELGGSSSISSWQSSASSKVRVDNSKSGAFTYGNDPVFNPKLDMVNPSFEVGQCFEDGKTFRAAVRELAIKLARDIRFVKNDKDRIRAKCKNVKCPW
ncbi:hypothetical protein OROGR_014986 [Orobanche gracilis]